MISALRQFACVESERRALGIGRGQLVAAEEKRGLEGNAGRLFGGPRTASRGAVGFSRELHLDLVDAEERGRARSVPSGRQRRAESIVIELIRTAVVEDAVAARYLAIRKLHDAGAFAARSPEPNGILAILEHGKRSHRES